MKQALFSPSNLNYNSEYGHEVHCYIVMFNLKNNYSQAFHYGKQWREIQEAGWARMLWKVPLNLS